MANFILCTFFAGLALAQAQMETKVAFASMNAGGKGVYGGISFTVTDDTMNIQGTIAGNLTDGYHGLHIHMGRTTMFNCRLIGDHYNPYNKTHGCDSATNHLGDLGNVWASNGIAYVNKTVPGITLAYSNGTEGNQNPGVLGLTIAIDETEDDCKNEASSGHPIACGKIRVLKYCWR